MKAVLLLSVVVPLGLLTIFKVGGLLGGEARISETLNLNPVNWTLERPGGVLHLDPNNRAERVFENDEISIWLDVTPLLYVEDGPLGTDDTLWQGISANISLTRGFLRSLNIVFTESAHLAAVRYQPTTGDLGTKLVGLGIDSYASGYGRLELRNMIRAFVNMSGLNRPSAVFFEDSSWWYLLGSQNQTLEMRIVFEIVYSNGVVFKRLVQPFSFRLSRDSNDSFETAQEITTGYHERLYIGNYDLHDFYKIDGTQGQQLAVCVNVTTGPLLLEAFFYDSSKNIIEVQSNNPFYEVGTFSFSIPSSGFVFLKIQPFRESPGSYGFYSLRVDLQ
jgi:hypothetical protein